MSKPPVARRGIPSRATRELAAERRRLGYRRLHALLRREGMAANHKRIFRLYQSAGLAGKRRRKRHGVASEQEQLALPSRPNEVRSMDFVSDALANGRQIQGIDHRG